MKSYSSSKLDPIKHIQFVETVCVSTSCGIYIHTDYIRTCSTFSFTLRRMFLNCKKLKWNFTLAEKKLVSKWTIDWSWSVHLFGCEERSKFQFEKRKENFMQTTGKPIEMIGLVLTVGWIHSTCNILFHWSVCWSVPYLLLKWNWWDAFDLLSSLVWIFFFFFSSPFASTAKCRSSKFYFIPNDLWLLVASLCLRFTWIHLSTSLAVCV